MRNQRSIGKMVACSGIGLHSGEIVNLIFLPAPVNTGVVFIRRDVNPPAFIKAIAQNVIATDLSTTVGHEGSVVQTVEHLLSAVMGLGIDNLYVELDGPEVPIFDGSAAPFVSSLNEAGIVSQGIGRSYMKILKTIEVKEGNKWIRIEPYHYFKVHCSIEYPHSVIGRQSFIFRNREKEFEQEIARARTFCFLHEIEALWNRGVARGGSLENAIVVGEDGVLNGNGLRFEDEFARHKVLDLLGDLFLIGMPLIGKVVANRGGHALHKRLVSKVLIKERYWKIVTPSEQEELVILPGVENLAPERLSL